MKKKPMKATVEHSDARFTIIIAHDRAASYSRAVKPRAMREAAIAMRQRSDRGNDFALTEIDYPEDCDDSGRAVSRYFFVRADAT